MGQKINTGEHALLVSSLVRIANKLGLERMPKLVQTPSLNEYLSRP